MKPFKQAVKDIIDRDRKAHNIVNNLDIRAYVRQDPNHHNLFTVYKMTVDGKQVNYEERVYGTLRATIRYAVEIDGAKFGLMMDVYPSLMHSNYSFGRSGEIRMAVEKFVVLNRYLMK